jgi:UDP-glucuronate decarboxylase
LTRKTVLVAGGAGFIGSHLCDHYLSQDWNVLCVDNLFTGRKENIDHLLGDKRFEFIRHDVTEPLTVETDLILNFACPASPVHYQYNPIKTVKTNVVGTLNLLGLAKRIKAVFVQASTSEVYGDPEVHPQPEDYWGHVNPIGPRSCYDEGKRLAETLCVNYKETHNLDVKIIRIFNTYGPRMQQNDGRVVSNFIVNALQNKPLAIYGEGLQTRSFCYIDDLIAGIVKVAALPHTMMGPVNLGNDGEFSMRELADLVIAMTSSSAGIQFEPLPKDDPRRRQPDLQRARQWLQWSAKVPLEAGLKNTIAYFRTVLGANS